MRPLQPEEYIMSHEIEDNNAFYVRQPAWHQLGVLLDNPPTSAEAIKYAGMDWKVEKRQLFFREETTYSPAVGRHATVRTSDGKFLAVVSDDYVPFQNSDAFAWFDPLVREGLASYESAGVLRAGSRIWVLAKVNKEIMVGKEDSVLPYLLLCNSHDATLRLGVMPTCVRVVCANTLRAALSGGNITTFRHVGNVLENMNEARNAVLAEIAKFDKCSEIYNEMAAKQPTTKEIEAYVEAVLGFPEIPDEDEGADIEKVDSASAYKQRAKDEILRLHEEGRGEVHGTLWGVYNAVAEFADHYAAPKSKDRANYSLFGAGAELLNRANEEALALLR